MEGGALVAESWQKASDSDTSFTVQVEPDADFLGSLNISIPTGSFTDLSRNPNASGSLSLPVNTDITAPALRSRLFRSLMIQVCILMTSSPQMMMASSCV